MERTNCSYDMIVNTALGFEEVNEGNQVITDFINLHKQDTLSGFRYLYRGMETTGVFFHSSFEWISPVLDCIERLGYDSSVTRIKKDGKITYCCKLRKEGETDFFCNIESDFKITAVWSAVITFCRDPKHQELKSKIKIK